MTFWRMKFTGASFEVNKGHKAFLEHHHHPVWKAGLINVHPALGYTEKALKVKV